MSATPQSVQQSTQISSPAQNLPNTNLQGPPVVQRNVSTESTFDSLVDNGLLGKEYSKQPEQPPEKPQKEPKAKAAPIEKAAPEPQLEPEAPKPKSDAQELQAADEGSEEEAPVAEEKAYESLEDFLTDAKLDPETFKDLPVTVKVDGKEDRIPLKEALSSYQQQAVLTQKSMAHADTVRQFETQRSEASKVIVQQVTASQNMLKLAEDTLLADYKQIDWNSLNQTDPARYAALQIDYQNRLAGIKGQLQQIDQAQQEQTRLAHEAQAKRLPEEFEKTLAAIPEWRDEGKRKDGQKKILDYARKLGFSDAELSITDHRQIVALHKAALYDALQASKPEALKKVRAAPVMAKPGARRDTTPQSLANQAATDAFKRNPRDEDAQAAYFERFT